MDAEDRTARQVELLKTIADASRLRILGLLADAPRTGRDLVEALGLSAPTVSHHMKRLEAVGVVVVTPDAVSYTHLTLPTSDLV